MELTYSHSVYRYINKIIFIGIVMSGILFLLVGWSKIIPLILFFLFLPLYYLSLRNVVYRLENNSLVKYFKNKRVFSVEYKDITYLELHMSFVAEQMIRIKRRKGDILTAGLNINYRLCNPREVWEFDQELIHRVESATPNVKVTKLSRRDFTKNSPLYSLSLK
jgi:hypothetical protein